MAVVQRPKAPIVATSAEADAASAAPKGMSPQMRNYIGGGVLLVCLLVGGGIVYWLLFGSSPSRRTIVVDPNQQTVAPMGPGMRVQQRPRDLKGVNKLDDSRWVIRGDAGAIQVTRDKAGKYSFRPSGQNNLGLSREQVNLLSARFRILQDPAMAKEWKVTDEQKKKLSAIKMDNSVAMAPTDLAAMQPLWDAYLKAGNDGKARMDAQKALTDKLDASAKANVDAAKKVWTDRVEQIRQILTPEQVQTVTK